MKTPKLTVVIPCLNEEPILEEMGAILLEKVKKMEETGSILRDSSLLFIDDHSSDRTWEIITLLSQKDSRIHGISLGKQSGQQTALYAGLMWARENCDICISMDCDGQDDPEAMEQMVEAWRQGSQIVYGVRKDRKQDPFWKRFSAERYYDLLAALGADVIKNHGDFRLMSREVLDELSNYQESALFLRGIMPLMGFEESCVYYERKPRLGGKTSYTPGKMAGLALDGITGSAVRPLRLFTVMGAGIFFGSLIAVCLAAFRCLQGEAVSGWFLTACILCLLGGLQLAGIGLAGEYLGRIYLEIKGRPRYRIAKETENRKDRDF